MTLNKTMMPLKYEGTSYSDKKYPLVTPFGMVWKGEMSENALRFMDFVFSDQGRKIISDYGVVPVSR